MKNNISFILNLVPSALDAVVVVSVLWALFIARGGR